MIRRPSVKALAPQIIGLVGTVWMQVPTADAVRSVLGAVRDQSPYEACKTFFCASSPTPPNRGTLL